MHLDITGRHIEITPAIREFAEDKLGKLNKLMDDPVEIHLILAIEKHRHSAEIVVKSRNAKFSGRHETGDLYASIGEVIDKVERQVLKHKEKLTDHKHRRGPRDPEIAATIEANVASDQVAEAGDADEDTVPGIRIVRSKRYRTKPLSPEDAALELEASGEDVLVFRDADTDRVHVVYRQKDGNIGLVEPEA